MKIFLGECVIILMIVFVTGCTKFPTSYDHIESDKVRIIDMTFEPCEAAPGDTVKLTTLFAGKDIKIEDIDWTVSWKLNNNIYGADSAFDPQSFTFVDPPQQKELSDKTTAITFSFKIPEKIMYESPMIPDNLMSDFKGYQNVPANSQSLSKVQLLNTVDGIVKMVKSGVTITDPQTLSMLPVMAQFLSVKFRVFADLKTAGYNAESDYSVRYNSIFSKIPGSRVFRNNNPEIDSVGIFKIPGSKLTKIDVSKYKKEFIRLFGPQDSTFKSDSAVPVTIDTGYTYFLCAFATGEDSTWTLQNLLKPDTSKAHTPTMELYNTAWFYEMNDSEISGVNQNNLMFLNEASDSTANLTPPIDKRVEHFTIWCKVKDNGERIPDELNRPLGATVKEIRGRFVYTQAYLNSIKSK